MNRRKAYTILTYLLVLTIGIAIGLAGALYMEFTILDVDLFVPGSGPTAPLNGGTNL